MSCHVMVELSADAFNKISRSSSGTWQVHIETAGINEIMYCSRQHYTKIVEASAAVDEMRDAALAIDQTLSASIDDGRSLNNAENVSEKGIPSFSPSEQFLKYEAMWECIADEKLLEATELLLELESLIGAQGDIRRARRVISTICEANLKGPLMDVQKMVVSFKTKLKLDKCEPVPLFTALVTNLLEQSITSADHIEKIVLCGRALDIPETVLSTQLKFHDSESIEALSALRIAIALNKQDDGFLKSIAWSFFNSWLQHSLSEESRVTHLFSACRELASVGETDDLPPDWTAAVRSKLTIQIPSSMQLILGPLLGPMEASETEPISMEKHFVPTGLPRIPKLPFGFHPSNP